MMTLEGVRRTGSLSGTRYIEVNKQQRYYLHECGPRNQSHVCKCLYLAGPCCRCRSEPTQLQCRSCREGLVVNLDDICKLALLIRVGDILPNVAGIPPWG